MKSQNICYEKENIRNWVNGISRLLTGKRQRYHPWKITSTESFEKLKKELFESFSLENSTLNQINDSQSFFNGDVKEINV